LATAYTDGAQIRISDSGAWEVTGQIPPAFSLCQSPNNFRPEVRIGHEAPPFKAGIKPENYFLRACCVIMELTAISVALDIASRSRSILEMVVQWTPSFSASLLWLRPAANRLALSCLPVIPVPIAFGYVKDNGLIRPEGGRPLTLYSRWLYNRNIAVGYIPDKGKIHKAPAPRPGKEE